MPAAGSKPHPCSTCGRRTYRRIRYFPAQGKTDERCQVCANAGFKPQQIEAHDLAATKAPPHKEAASKPRRSAECPEQEDLWAQAGDAD